MTEIQTRLLAEGGPAVLFEKPLKADGSPSDMPVLVNLFGTVKRVAMGVTMGGKERRDAAFAARGRRTAGHAAPARTAAQPRRSDGSAAAGEDRDVDEAEDGGRLLGGKPACQEVVLKGDDIDLARLPVQTCWPGEPAPLITWPLVVTKGPARRAKTITISASTACRCWTRTRRIMRWLKHRGGAQHHARWSKEKREPLPAAAVIGADPGTILAAVTPVPDTLSEYQFAGLLRGSRVELADCVSQPLKVPAEAEIVIEGEVSLDDYRDEGPYGDHTGYYNSVEHFPVFTVDRHHHAARSDLSLDLHRPAAGRALRAGRSAERGVHSAAEAAVPGDRRFLAAAGRLLLPHRRRLHEEGLSRPRQAGDDGACGPICASSCTPNG